MLIVGKIDTAGTLQVVNGYTSSSTKGSYIVQTSDGGYLACGHDLSGTFGDYDVIVIKFDASLEIENSWILGSSNRETCSALEMQTDGSVKMSIYDATATITHLAHFNQDFNYCGSLSIQSVVLTKTDILNHPSISVTNPTTAIE